MKIQIIFEKKVFIKKMISHLEKLKESFKQNSI